MAMNRIRRKAERGAALLNLALAISLGILVTAGAFWVAAPALEKGRMRASVEMVEEVADAIRRGWAHELDYGSLTETALGNRGTLRSNYWRGNTLYGPLGNVDVGPWVMASCGWRGYCNRGFNVALRDLSVAACRTLATEIVGLSHFATAVRSTAGVYTTLSGNTTAEIQTACGPDNGNSATVIFFFG